MIVQTESAVYVLDHLRGMLTRFPRQTEVGGEVYVADLRRDGKPIPFEVIGELAVGQPAQFQLRIRNDGVSTIRTTTPVVEITGK
jgi:hypothetical protein